MVKTILPKGLAMRPATQADIERIYDLARAYELVQYGKVTQSLDEIRKAWTGPNLNLSEDSLLAFDQTERLVGYLRMEHTQHAKFYVAVRLLPDYSDVQLGNYLLELAETRARERMLQSEPGVRATLSTTLPGSDIIGQRLHIHAGLQEIRRFWEMEIELTQAPPAPAWPAGTALRPYMPNRDEFMVFDLINTAFRDHWGHIPNRFEEWRHWTIERENFDPSLWFVVYEGEQAVGSATCSDEGEHGWIDDLGVLRPWRGKGLGMALLLHSFGEFYRRGKRKVGLGVDSQNLTGALRLYQRAGMHMVREKISYEKELRAGVELSTRVLVD